MTRTFCTFVIVQKFKVLIGAIFVQEQMLFYWLCLGIDFFIALYHIDFISFLYNIAGQELLTAEKQLNCYNVIQNRFCLFLIKMKCNV